MQLSNDQCTIPSFFFLKAHAVSFPTTVCVKIEKSNKFASLWLASRSDTDHETSKLPKIRWISNKRTDNMQWTKTSRKVWSSPVHIVYFTCYRNRHIPHIWYIQIVLYYSIDIYIYIYKIQRTSRYSHWLRHMRVWSGHPTIARGTPHTNRRAGRSEEGGLSYPFMYVYIYI